MIFVAQSIELINEGKNFRRCHPLSVRQMKKEGKESTIITDLEKGASISAG